MLPANITESAWAQEFKQANKFKIIIFESEQHSGELIDFFFFFGQICDFNIKISSNKWNSQELIVKIIIL